MYKIAIPSYRRPETLKRKTLNLLQNHKIKPNKIFIFVSDNEQKDLYQNELPNNSYNKLIVGEKGIKNIRNFMSNYFNEGERIFYIDDDISHVYINKNNVSLDNEGNIGEKYSRSDNKLFPLENLDSFIRNAFKLAKKMKIDNWGIYPVENPYFTKPTTNNLNDYISTKLNYIMGGFTGVINNRNCEVRTIDDKEDYERSIKYYLKDGGVLRFNNVCCRTNCYKEPGGMQIDRTKDKITKAAKYLTRKYPQLCKLNTKKKSGFTEVRLRDNRNMPTSNTYNSNGNNNILTSYNNKLVTYNNSRKANSNNGRNRGNNNNKTRKILSNIRNKELEKSGVKSSKNNINLDNNNLEEIDINKTNIKKCNKFKKKI